MRTTSLTFTEQELQYALMMLIEGQIRINQSKNFESFQNIKKQEDLIQKVRNELWNFHDQKL